jgi:hypothetical protein
MEPSASPFGFRLLRTSRERFSIGASCGSSSWRVGPAAARWRSRGVCARTTPTDSTSAGGITKEEQSAASSRLMGDSDMGFRIVAVQYTTLEIKYYSRCPAANASWSNAACS